MLGFRIVGEVFAALPTVRNVVLSGYSQRLGQANGHVNDEYLYSVRIGREQWSVLNFETLNPTPLETSPCPAAGAVLAMPVMRVLPKDSASGTHQGLVSCSYVR